MQLKAITNLHAMPNSQIVSVPGETKSRLLSSFK